MIKQVSIQIADYFVRKSVVQEERAKVYAYGFELLISTLVNTALLILIAALLGSLSGGLLYMAGFIPLRLSAGGYHAKRHWTCVIAANGTFLGFALLLRLLPPYGHIWILYSLLSSIFSAMTIWLLSPVEAVNKPLKEKQKIKLRDISLVLAAVMTMLTIVVAIVHLPYTEQLAYYVSGGTSAAISLIVAKLQNRVIKKII